MRRVLAPAHPPACPRPRTSAGAGVGSQPRAAAGPAAQPATVRGGRVAARHPLGRRVWLQCLLSSHIGERTPAPRSQTLPPPTARHRPAPAAPTLEGPEKAGGDEGDEAADSQAKTGRTKGRIHEQESGEWRVTGRGEGSLPPPAVPLLAPATRSRARPPTFDPPLRLSPASSRSAHPGGSLCAQVCGPCGRGVGPPHLQLAADPERHRPV